jgi:hypothetical protein
VKRGSVKSGARLSHIFRDFPAFFRDFSTFLKIFFKSSKDFLYSLENFLHFSKISFTFKEIFSKKFLYTKVSFKPPSTDPSTI